MSPSGAHPKRAHKNREKTVEVTSDLNIHQQVREKLSGFPHLSEVFELSYPNLESWKAVIR